LFRDDEHLLLYIRYTIEAFIWDMCFVVPKIPTGRVKWQRVPTSVDVQLALVNQEDETQQDQHGTGLASVGRRFSDTGQVESVDEHHAATMPLPRNIVKRGIDGPVWIFRGRAFRDQDHVTAYINERVFQLLAPPVTKRDAGPSRSIAARLTFEFGRVKKRPEPPKIQDLMAIGGEKVLLIKSPEFIAGEPITDLLD
jgi:hypothetical protein